MSLHLATSDIIFLLININSIDIPTTGYSQLGSRSANKDFHKRVRGCCITKLSIEKGTRKNEERTGFNVVHA